MDRKHIEFDRESVAVVKQSDRDSAATVAPQTDRGSLATRIIRVNDSNATRIIASLN